MIQISKKITVEGFESKKEFEEWLKEQEEKESNENILKTFKWFLTQLENDVKNNKYNKNNCDAVDKYAVKMIDRKIMNEESIIKFIRQAQNLG